MKNLALLLIIILALVNHACKNEPKQKEVLLPTEVVENPVTAGESAVAKDGPRIFFEKTTHDFGRLKEGERLEYSFVFTNKGNADLLIDHCSGSCGCTVPEWPKDPIRPGEQGKIKVSFDSQGRSGMNDKTITILANTIPRSTILRVTAQVTK
jgi:hypothetical protein